MAALAVPTTIKPGLGTLFSPSVVYAGTVTRLMPVYRDTADGTYQIADANVVGKTAVAGLAFSPGSAAEYGVLVTEGPLELTGTTLVKGTTYYLGSVAGEIVTESDLVAGCEVVRVGIAASATRLNVKIEKTGIVI